MVDWFGDTDRLPLAATGDPLSRMLLALPLTLQWRTVFSPGLIEELCRPNVTRGLEVDEGPDGGGEGRLGYGNVAVSEPGTAP